MPLLHTQTGRRYRPYDEIYKEDHMGLNKTTVAPRMTEVPADLTAKLEAVDGAGQRNAFRYQGDKYGTVLVRAYLPPSISPKVLDGFVIDYSDASALAEDADDLTNKSKLRARSVITFDKAGKPSGFAPMGSDNPETTCLIAVDIPDWADVDTVTITV